MPSIRNAGDIVGKIVLSYIRKDAFIKGDAMSRRKIREHIFKLLFRIEFNNISDMPEQMQLYFEDNTDCEPVNKEYIEKKYQNILDKLKEIDEILAKATKGWQVNRIGKVELTILRLAIYEMLYDEEVPLGVAINEAVELAKKYGGEESHIFINGILAKVVSES